MDLSRRVVIDDDHSYPVLVRIEAHAGWGREGRGAGWLAKVTARLNPNGLNGVTLDHEFVTPCKQSLSKAGNGTKEYLLPAGVYHANSVWRTGVSAEYIICIRGADDVVVSTWRSEDALGALLSAEEIAAAKAAAEKIRNEGLRLVESLQLPPLEGSPKQVLWASNIRTAFATNVVKMKGDQTPFSCALAMMTKASWWIQNRDDLVVVSLEVFARLR